MRRVTRSISERGSASERHLMREMNFTVQHNARLSIQTNQRVSYVELEHWLQMFSRTRAILDRIG